MLTGASNSLNETVTFAPGASSVPGMVNVARTSRLVSTASQTRCGDVTRRAGHDRGQVTRVEGGLDPVRVDAVELLARLGTPSRALSSTLAMPRSGSRMADGSYTVDASASGIV